MTVTHRSSPVTRREDPKIPDRVAQWAQRTVAGPLQRLFRLGPVASVGEFAKVERQPGERQAVPVKSCTLRGNAHLSAHATPLPRSASRPAFSAVKGAGGDIPIDTSGKRDLHHVWIDQGLALALYLKTVGQPFCRRQERSHRPHPVGHPPPFVTGGSVGRQGHHYRGDPHQRRDHDAGRRPECA